MIDKQPLFVTCRTIGLGWVNYSDTVHTVVSPQSITAGARAQWTNNGGTALTAYMPTGGALWQSNAFTPALAGEAYLLRVDFTYEPAGNNTFIEVDLDIGSDPFGASSTPIVKRTINASKGTDVQYASFTSSVYCLETFIANGCVIGVTAQDNDVTIWAKQITITRIFRP